MVGCKSLSALKMSEFPQIEFMQRMVERNGNKRDSRPLLSQCALTYAGDNALSFLGPFTAQRCAVEQSRLSVQMQRDVLWVPSISSGSSLSSPSLRTLYLSYHVLLNIYNCLFISNAPSAEFPTHLLQAPSESTHKWCHPSLLCIH